MSGRKKTGFTLIELLVVLAIIALLLSVVGPRYFTSVERSREAVLREDLNVLRDAIDKYFSDVGHYPNSLDDLVAGSYIRTVPIDPITQHLDTWILVAPRDTHLGVVFDIKSGAQGKTHDGTPYGDL